MAPFGPPWALFGVLWGALGSLWRPLGRLGRPPGRLGVPLGSFRQDQRKPRKTLGFSWFFYSADGPRLATGKDNLDPVEDVLNENPSHVALGKLTQRTRERRVGAQTPPPHAPGPFGRLGAPVADFGLPLAPFGVPLGSLWPSFGTPLAILGHPLAPFGVPSGSLWPSFGAPLAIVGPKGRLWGQARAGPGRPLGQ